MAYSGRSASSNTSTAFGKKLSNSCIIPTIARKQNYVRVLPICFDPISPLTNVVTWQDWSTDCL